MIKIGRHAKSMSAENLFLVKCVRYRPTEKVESLHLVEIKEEIFSDHTAKRTCVMTNGRRKSQNGTENWDRTTASYYGSLVLDTYLVVNSETSTKFFIKEMLPECGGLQIPMKAVRNLENMLNITLNPEKKQNFFERQKKLEYKNRLY